MKRSLPAIVVNALLVIGALATAAPLLWMISASFMPAGQSNELPPRLLPSRSSPTLPSACGSSPLAAANSAASPPPSPQTARPMAVATR
jgi:ABC-type glycerol-3-phosphate transport system permease component